MFRVHTAEPNDHRPSSRIERDGRPLLMYLDVSDTFARRQAAVMNWHEAGRANAEWWPGCTLAEWQARGLALWPGAAIISDQFGAVMGLGRVRVGQWWKQPRGAGMGMIHYPDALLIADRSL